MTLPLGAEREAIAAVCRRLADRGLVVGSAGNVSVRVGGQVAVTATGAHFESMSADLVTVVGIDGAPLPGGLEATSELELHLGLYADTGATAVVHTHAPMGVAVGCVLTELPCVHYQMLLLGGSVRVAPYATFGSSELASHVREALVGRSAALMANHGAVAVGGSLEEAAERAMLLEWAATIYWRAATLGEPRVLSQADQEAVIEAAIRRRYGQVRSSDADVPTDTAPPETAPPDTAPPGGAV